MSRLRDLIRQFLVNGNYYFLTGAEPPQQPMADVGKGLFFWHTRKRCVAAPPNFIAENNNAYIYIVDHIYKTKVIQDHHLASRHTISNCTGERNNNYYKVMSRQPRWACEDLSGGNLLFNTVTDDPHRCRPVKRKFPSSPNLFLPQRKKRLVESFPDRPGLNLHPALL